MLAMSYSLSHCCLSWWWYWDRRNHIWVTRILQIWKAKPSYLVYIEPQCCHSEGSGSDSLAFRWIKIFWENCWLAELLSSCSWMNSYCYRVHHLVLLRENNEGGIWLRPGFLWNCLVLRLTGVWWGWEAPPQPEPSEDWRDAVCSSLGFLLRCGPAGNRERNSKFSSQKLVEKIETPLSLQRKFSQLIGLPNLSNSSQNLSFNWWDF